MLCSWLWLSRLAAAKEFAFMEALGAAGFPVPRAVDHNRHAVLMSLVDAIPLVQVAPPAVFTQKGKHIKCTAGTCCLSGHAWHAPPPASTRSRFIYD